MDRHHCLVTGANRGLGLEFVRQLLARGDHVIAACRHPGKAQALNVLAGEHPGRLKVLPLELGDPRSHAELAREVALVNDGERLDLLINNAGVLRGGERFGQVALADLDASFHTNAAGPFLLTQALAEQLADGGKVANLSSEVGSIGLRQEFRTPSYAIGKAAQNMATTLLAQALSARGITVVALHPGWVRTDMGGPQAALTPQESVAALLTLLQKAGLEQSGSFLDWQGDPLPW
ncbi:SDR family oxidoreductase [Pseudoxanthomonas indica]|uniref:NAD(P)-dependent dehydrogenase, short-chain alcohol dehydrogenase family n=1 Tax=Pseudoxanthomonas indica TaxID=428993 RepID=A0A1T5KUA0_9GAMM|nr:SDR family oxidoreductase [Pseudoxanthomonas indica]GGD51475.1 short-chain dehydrogenase [Pseudoxanthomonas indica]SKC67035.1 NAD(P)-dependent dehydrogenase, short-chain alcohol dehydrogenase family [Pseudoxanthomonas indica]